MPRRNRNAGNPRLDTDQLAADLTSSPPTCAPAAHRQREEHHAYPLPGPHHHARLRCSP